MSDSKQECPTPIRVLLESLQFAWEETAREMNSNH